MNKIRLTKASRLRAMRTSEVLSFLFLCGVDVFCDNRPPLEQPLADVKQTIFYSSYEIKAFNEEGRKMLNARFAGLLRSYYGNYLIYSIGNELIQWNGMSEIRAGQIIGRLVHSETQSLLLADAFIRTVNFIQVFELLQIGGNST